MRELTERQKAALEVFLAGGDVKAAAQAAGVSCTTIRTWLKQSAFREALARAEAEASTDPALQALRAAVGLVKGLRVPGDGEHREAETQKR
jgi:transposase-like protein